MNVSFIPNFSMCKKLTNLWVNAECNCYNAEQIITNSPGI